MDRQDRYFSTKADYDKTVCFLKRNDYVTDKKKERKTKKKIVRRNYQWGYETSQVH